MTGVPTAALAMGVSRFSRHGASPPPDDIGDDGEGITGGEGWGALCDGICDYSTGFREPEMVKERLAVVVSPRLPHRDGLCTVVPLSTTPSRSGIRYQCRVTLPTPAPRPYDGTIKWAKADMLATVTLGRLNLPYTGRDPVSGQRRYLQITVTPDDMNAIRSTILHALGLDRLTDHL